MFKFPAAKVRKFWKVLAEHLNFNNSITQRNTNRKISPFFFVVSKTIPIFAV